MLLILQLINIWFIIWGTSEKSVSKESETCSFPCSTIHHRHTKQIKKNTFDIFQERDDIEFFCKLFSTLTFKYCVQFWMDLLCKLHQLPCNIAYTIFCARKIIPNNLYECFTIYLYLQILNKYFGDSNITFCADSWKIQMCITHGPVLMEVTV